MRFNSLNRVESASAANSRARSNLFSLRAMGRFSHIRLDIYNTIPYIRINAYEEVPIMGTHEAVREKYGSVATDVAQSGSAACCNPQLRCCDPITKDLYSADEQGSLPEKAVLASLGCGNPTALIDLRAGETVLDLGSGGGIDVLLSAKRVGPTGKAYGLDMTDEMLALAR